MNDSYSNIIEINEHINSQKNYILDESNLYDFNNLGLPLIIDKTGIRFNEKTTLEEVKIGNQIWMTKNLNVSVFQNGDSIVQAKSKEEWTTFLSQGKAAWCYYNFAKSNSNEVGKIYNWFAITDKRLLIPKGWHIPSASEWEILDSNLRCSSKVEDFENNQACVSAKIKKNDKSWQQNIPAITNESGLSALPGGRLVVQWGELSFEESCCAWWTSTFINDLKFISIYELDSFKDQFYDENKGWISETIKNIILIKFKKKEQNYEVKTVNLENHLFFDRKDIGSGLYIRCVKD
jgi:uncharacterized protein (TIGR02145 family)